MFGLGGGLPPAHTQFRDGRSEVANVDWNEKETDTQPMGNSHGNFEKAKLRVHRRFREGRPEDATRRCRERDTDSPVSQRIIEEPLRMWCEFGRGRLLPHVARRPLHRGVYPRAGLRPDPGAVPPPRFARGRKEQQAFRTPFSSLARSAGEVPRRGGGGRG